MDGNKTRRWLIIIAAIPIIIAVLYLSGLIGQIIESYRNYNNLDGILGGVIMELPNPNFFYCLSNAFTADGLIGLLIVIIGTAVIIFIIDVSLN